VKFGSISSCLTGEIDMTFGKPALTKNSSDEVVLKGVQVDRFVFKTQKEEISQGEIDFVNYKKLKSIISDKKIHDSAHRRIALQGLTGVNEKRRIKATIIEQNIYLANSCNYLLENEVFKLELLVAWLNSKLLNFVFKTRSTSSNVNGYEVDNLPFCSSAYNGFLIDLVLNILKKKGLNKLANTVKIEKQIDDTIYKIFDLTNEEIEIIENSIK
jgi:hypothetical protein